MPDELFPSASARRLSLRRKTNRIAHAIAATRPMTHHAATHTSRQCPKCTYLPIDVKPKVMVPKKAMTTNAMRFARGESPWGMRPRNDEA